MIYHIKLRNDYLQPDLIVYNAAVHACGDSGEWAAALGLLAELRQQMKAQLAVQAEEHTRIYEENRKKWKQSVLLIEKYRYAQLHRRECRLLRQYLAKLPYECRGLYFKFIDEKKVNLLNNLFFGQCHLSLAFLSISAEFVPPNPNELDKNTSIFLFKVFLTIFNFPESSSGFSRLILGAMNEFSIIINE